MFAATTKRSFLLDDIAKTCDVLEEAVNLAFEGRPGPVHIHVPEDLTLHGQSVENYRDIKLNVKPVLPDPSEIANAAAALADAFRSGKSVMALVGFGAVRSGAGPELQRSSSASRSRSPPRSTARESLPKITRWGSGCSPTAATRPLGRLSSPPTS